MKTGPRDEAGYTENCRRLFLTQRPRPALPGAGCYRPRLRPSVASGGVDAITKVSASTTSDDSDLRAEHLGRCSGTAVPHPLLVLTCSAIACAIQAARDK